MGATQTFDTPLPTPDWVNSVKVMWGTDFALETTSMPVNVFDGAAYDASGGTMFVKTGTRGFMPETQHNQYSVFAQLEIEATDRLTLRGGARQQWANAEVGDFITLGQGNQIEGGEISYSELLPNVGAIYSLTDEIKVYADYARSFELPDIGLQLRYAPAGFNFSASTLKPVITDSYEVGLRFDFGDTTGSVAGFYSNSKWGPPRIENLALVQSRNPERIYGVELALDHTINEQWQVGGSLTWMEGELQDTASGRWTALNGLSRPACGGDGTCRVSADRLVEAAHSVALFRVSRQRLR
jgi:iron complex outermembrane receptor protein